MCLLSSNEIMLRYVLFPYRLDLGFFGLSVHIGENTLEMET